MTRNEIIREYFRLGRIVNEAQEQDLLDADEAQDMRERYHERAERALRAIGPPEVVLAEEVSGVAGST